MPLLIFVLHHWPAFMNIIYDEDAIVRGLGLDCSKDDHLHDVDEQRLTSDCRDTSFSCRMKLRNTYLPVMAYAGITTDPKTYFRLCVGASVPHARFISTNCAYGSTTSWH